MSDRIVMDKALLASRIQRLAQGRVLVVGDVAIDEMIYGEPSRLSREAPVMILKHTQTDILLGAGGNAAHNLTALGAKKVTMVGLAGKDYHCSLLFDAMTQAGIQTDAMVQDSDRPTITKTRISGQARQSVRQQIVRIDRETNVPAAGAIEQALVEKIMQYAPGHDAILLSDYALGVVTPKVIAACQEAARAHNLVWAVDSHNPLSLFKDATIATPNQIEAETNLNISLTALPDLETGGQTLRKTAQLKNLLITRGADGMTLFDEQGRIFHIPVFNKSEVFDVTGAGDTVIGTLTLALVTGATGMEAAVLGNLDAKPVLTAEQRPHPQSFRKRGI